MTRRKHHHPNPNSSSTAIRPYKRSIKIICVGPAEAGKTSLIKRYVLNQPLHEQIRQSTRGVDFLNKRIPNPIHPHGNEYITIQLFDTAGQEKYGTALPSSFYRGADGALLIYDASSRRSFQRCVRWLHILKEKLDISREEEEHGSGGGGVGTNRKTAKNSFSIPIVVVANKLDLLYHEVSKPMRVVPQRKIFFVDYARLYYGPGLKQASVEDLVRAAGGVEAARRAGGSYGHVLSSTLEPVVNDAISSSQRLPSAWRDQTSSSESAFIHGIDPLYKSLDQLEDGDDVLPDRESILLWCRQHGLGHLETSALDGTGELCK